VIEPSSYKNVNAKELELELAKNKKLISMTMGEEGNSSGSESEPSADNLDEEEMAQIVPIKISKKPLPKKDDKKKKAATMSKKPSSPIGRKPPAVVKEI